MQWLAVNACQDDGTLMAQGARRARLDPAGPTPTGPCLRMVETSGPDTSKWEQSEGISSSAPRNERGAGIEKTAQAELTAWIVTAAILAPCHGSSDRMRWSPSSLTPRK